VAASLGLEKGAERALLAEPPLLAERIDVHDDIEPRIAKALVRGAWVAAASDSVDPREERIIATVAKRLQVSPEDVEAARGGGAGYPSTRSGHRGAASVDAIRYVLFD